MPRPATPLADIHVHLYGSILAADYLEFVRNQDVDWERYESAYQAAYGVTTPARDILERRRSGEPARRRSSTACSFSETRTPATSSDFRQR